MSTVKEDKEYAFEMATSTVRFGRGVTREVGMDLKNMGAKKVAVFTDPKLANLPPMQVAIESLQKANVPFVVYDKVRIEPTDVSFRHAIEFTKREQPDAFLAVGGGSTIDTAKAANLYLSHDEADFLDFVNSPIGKGKPVTKPVKPLIAVPTTAGTGSETTGVSIFDYTPLHAKTGIASRALKPLLGIIDPENVRSMPPEVRVASGLDVLCHALESYTAIPYTSRPRPSNPIDRPTYQGANPISDLWSIRALAMTAKYLPRTYRDPTDTEAQEQMLLASTFAGIGFGNAGVHLCHGMSYPIAGNIGTYKHKGYDVGHSIVPHGISVALTAPAVFSFTSDANPERHIEAAQLFGVDTSRLRKEDAGKALSDALRKFLHELDVPNGLKAVGYGLQDVDKLVEGTLPQHRVTKLAPHPVGYDEIAELIEKSMEIY
ncbi:Hydroxyacid-oxoacid transhydrogenase, mitochondrial [Gaertneriomyces sp. JEL0708]|nr:Hydroxyacid-oxoacid transhydrogenase, mitochondrial [Gaertneriomyces sp. JEL0708]